MIGQQVRNLVNLIVARERLVEMSPIGSQIVVPFTIARLEAQINEAAAELDQALAETLNRVRYAQT